MPISLSNKPHCIISMGDPSGIGPEIIVRSLSRKTMRSIASFFIVGDINILRYAAKKLSSKLRFCTCQTALAPLPEKNALGVFSPCPLPKAPIRGAILRRYGKCSISYLDYAIKRAQKMPNSVLVTAPICKESVILSGLPNFTGHTGYLAKKTSSKNTIMMFFADKLRVGLFTQHIPYSRVPSTLTINKLAHFIEQFVSEVKKKFNCSNPRIAIAGLNPHAGEGGAIGHEESSYIMPALKKVSYPIAGPIPADVIFYKAYHGAYDFIIALYHDQALAPFKMLYRDTGVNVTLGLPFIRTSPDHGTAFDISRSYTANPDSFINSLRLACRLSRL